MNGKIRELFENTWVIDDQGVYIFVAAGEEKALMIDTGRSGLDVTGLARQVTDLPLELVNTHADPDHVAGNQAFERFYMHPSEAMVYHNLRHGAGTIVPVYDGDEIDLGKRVFRVLHVPGHTPGSITLLDKGNRCLIGGDPVQEDGDIYMFGIHRDMEAYILGLKRLLARAAEFDRIYPSHAGLPVTVDIISKLIDGAGDILAGKVQGEPKTVHDQEILSFDVGVSRFLCEKGVR